MGFWRWEEGFTGELWGDVFPDGKASHLYLNHLPGMQSEDLVGHIASNPVDQSLLSPRMIGYPPGDIQDLTTKHDDLAALLNQFPHIGGRVLILRPYGGCRLRRGHASGQSEEREERKEERRR